MQDKASLPSSAPGQSAAGQSAVGPSAPDLPAAQPPEHDPGAPPTICTLEHRVFRRFGDVIFRRAESDDTPAMVIALGERIAAVPLRALQREVDIPDDSPDGRMLGLIAQALDFVTALQPGDPLPTEVLDGRASWNPEPCHKAIAAARLRLQLAAWLQPDAAGVTAPDVAMVRRLDEDPAMRQHVQAAMEKAADQLGMASRAEVLEALEALADELGYIEALREHLLVRLRETAGRIDHLQRAGRFNFKRRDMVVQVARLTAIALTRIDARFGEIDAMGADIIEALRNLDNQCSLIRSSRDWLYRLSRAWDPILTEWKEISSLPDSALWALIERTYRFLAPRYMQVQEWLASCERHVTGDRQMNSAMTW